MSIFFSAIISLIFCLVLIVSFASDQQAFDYPTFIGFGGLCFSLIFFSIVWLKKVPAGQALVVIPDKKISILRFILFLLVWLIYIPFLDFGGFILSSWLALTLSITLLNGALNLKSGIVSFLFVFVFSLLINTVLYVPVPQGYLDRQVESLIYNFSLGG